MKIPCSGPGCAERRIHWEEPNTPRGVQYVEVPDGFEGSKAYCSITCAVLDGAVKVNSDEPVQENRDRKLEDTP